jgi:hypothetical protein
MDNFGNSKAIHTVRLPAVYAALQQMHVDQYYGSLRDRHTIKQSVTDLGNLVKDWLNPIVDCSSFPHVYHSNGTHASIEQWLLKERRSVYCFRGEYTYPLHLRNDITVVDTVLQIPDSAVVYMSMPFSATGKYDDRYYQVKNPVILDLAYVGTTDLHSIRITHNTEQIFWSGSKAFAIGHYRTGVRFTRTPDVTQEHINSVGYVNWLGIDILKTCVAIYSVYDLYRMFDDAYSTICIRNNLQKSDSFLIAHGNEYRYNWLAREDGTLRVPTGLVLDTIYGINDGLD